MQNLKIADETFFVVDLDRTLLNTGLVFDILQSTLDDHGYDDGNKLHNTRKQLEANGETFVVFGYIESLLSSQELKVVIDAFRAKAEEYELFNEGAQEFLAFLRKHQLPFGILTYGSKRWQQEKLKIAGLNDVPTIIIPQKGKGEVVSTWYYKDTETFVVPADFGAGTYTQLIMIDDKAGELSGLPPHATGLLYRPTDDILPSQAGEIEGKNLHLMRSFKEVTDYILALL